MSFVSFNFWIVFPLIFGLYWLIPAKYNQWRKLFLIVVSYLLYMNWKPAFALVLLGVTLVTYWGGRFLQASGDENIDEDDSKRKGKIWLFAILSLLPLLVFKYYNFVNESIWSLLSYLGLRYVLHGLNWTIPIGISFFTFQAVGYLFDVYYKRFKAEKSLVDYMLFVGFFPQIASGPISKAAELLPQIKEVKAFNSVNAIYGVRLIVWGLFLKLVIADRLGMCVDTIYRGYEVYSGLTGFIGSIFYSFQIYCDFSGYTYLAMGIANLLGSQLINNFKRPYFSISITDFWRRWHISLSRWLKDYVYIPLGGSRCSKARSYWNIFVTFLVSGLWHGANWTFVIWGIFHGVVQIVEKYLGFQKTNSNNKLIIGSRILITFFLVNLAWIFFRMPSIGNAIAFINHIITTPGGFDMEATGFTSLFILIVSIPILFLHDSIAEWYPYQHQLTRKPVINLLLLTILLALVLSVGVLDSSTFIYANF